MTAPWSLLKPELMQLTGHPLGSDDSSSSPEGIGACSSDSSCSRCAGHVDSSKSPEGTRAGPGDSSSSRGTECSDRSRSFVGSAPDACHHPRTNEHLMVTAPIGLGHLLRTDSPQCLDMPLLLPWLLALHWAPQEGQEPPLGCTIPELVLQLPEEKHHPYTCLFRCTANPGPITEPSRAATARGPAPRHLPWVQAPRWRSGSCLGSWPSTGSDTGLLAQICLAQSPP